MDNLSRPFFRVILLQMDLIHNGGIGSLPSPGERGDLGKAIQTIQENPRTGNFKNLSLGEKILC